MKTLWMFVFITLWPFASYAQQQQACAPNKAFLDHLEKNYHEAPAGYGTLPNGYMVELLMEPDGRTWTIIVTSPQGLSCLVSSGEGWRVLTPPVDGPEA